MKFTSRNVALPGSTPQPATITVDIDTGKIKSVDLTYSPASADVDAGDLHILPGMVDSHVHMNEPGRTDWEGFNTGTKAAAAGGLTTVVDMPLNAIPPTTTVSNFDEKRAAAKNKCWTDVAFWGGIIPGNQSDLVPLIRAGVKGFKCFLIASGVDEFPCVTEGDLEAAMDVLKDTPTVILLHSELEGAEIPIDPQSDPTFYSTFLASRPEVLETDAIELVMRLQKKYPLVRCHIVHLSAASGVPMIREARAAGLNLTVETCFHYLFLHSADIPNGHPEFKCCPPIREDSNRDQLWAALQEGVIDCVVSDHSPCVAELKKIEEGDVMAAWGGISTLGLGLSLLWTEGEKRGATIADLVRWTSEKTADHAGLAESKGRIQVGRDADFIIWDPAASFTVTKESLHFKNKLSPYVGRELRGRVEATYLRGHKIYDRKTAFEGLSPRGQLL